VILAVRERILAEKGDASYIHTTLAEKGTVFLVIPTPLEVS
jgi:hypothetical protein